MASTERTTDAASNNITTAQRDAANTNFTAGAVIAASDLTYLKDRINNVCGHTHDLDDYTKIGTYGNQKSTTSASARADTTAGAGTDSSLSISAGDVIHHDHHNSLRNAVNTVRSHNHSWTDNS
jgi:hypothetical protein